MVKEETKDCENRAELYRYYPKVIFKIGLYRKSEPIVLTLFIPMGLIMLFIGFLFWTNIEKNDKFAIIAGLLLATYSF